MASRFYPDPLSKQDGRYYLLVAEGGTHFNHAVMVAEAKTITGPYESNPRNPILTSRHLGYDHWVHSTGHADLVELPDGRWYAVTLGIRGDEQRASNMGRETHLVPVRWEREPFWWKEDRVLARQPLAAHGRRLVLRLDSGGGLYRFSWSGDGGARFTELHREPADRVLSRGYTGALLGLHATGNGQNTGDFADFDRVAYRARER